MGTHRITVELTDAAYAVLREKVESGEFGSEADGVNRALEGFDEEGAFEPADADFELWMEREVIPAAEYAEAHPETTLTGEQLLAYLAGKRAARQLAQ